MNSENIELPITKLRFQQERGKSPLRQPFLRFHTTSTFHLVNEGSFIIADLFLPVRR